MASSKKIYITSLHFKHGGVENVIASISNLFIETGYSVEILCIYDLGKPAYKINDDVKITYLTNLKPNREQLSNAIRSKNPFRILKEGIYSTRVLFARKYSLIKAIKRIKNGTIISTRNEHSVLLSKYGSKDVFKIAQLHHDHRFDPTMINDFKHNYQNIDEFLLLTPRLTEEVAELIANTNQHTHCRTMPNFIDVASPKSIPVKKKKVIAAGRLHPDKAFDKLLHIWREFITLNNDFELNIYGEGELLHSLTDLAIELDITNSVKFRGSIDNQTLLKEMAESYMYVMTSPSEGFPLVLLESMSQYTPAIAYDVRVGPEAIIDSGKNGFLIPDDNIELFTQAMVTLVNDRDLYDQMAISAFNRSQEFTKNQIKSRWLNLLEKTTNTKKEYL
ncbi:glycosyltransferase [Erysipelothrix anatis]|uniref:glycosyltransferase n=1 Tax=Erysipelothrix anatis TaxID=2683713 RepID=UPI00135CA8CB|nr:glycosyltransferase [Erysipelothrix anatis]